MPNFVYQAQTVWFSGGHFESKMMTDITSSYTCPMCEKSFKSVKLFWRDQRTNTVTFIFIFTSTVNKFVDCHLEYRQPV